MVQCIHTSQLFQCHHVCQMSSHTPSMVCLLTQVTELGVHVDRMLDVELWTGVRTQQWSISESLNSVVAYLHLDNFNMISVDPGWCCWAALEALQHGVDSVPAALHLWLVCECCNVGGGVGVQHSDSNKEGAGRAVGSNGNRSRRWSCSASARWQLVLTHLQCLNCLIPDS